MSYKEYVVVLGFNTYNQKPLSLNRKQIVPDNITQVKYCISILVSKTNLNTSFFKFLDNTEFDYDDAI